MVLAPPSASKSRAQIKRLVKLIMLNNYIKQEARRPTFRDTSYDDQVMKSKHH